MWWVFGKFFVIRTNHDFKLDSVWPTYKGDVTPEMVCGHGRWLMTEAMGPTTFLSLFFRLSLSFIPARSPPQPHAVRPPSQPHAAPHATVRPAAPSPRPRCRYPTRHVGLWTGNTHDRLTVRRPPAAVPVIHRAARPPSRWALRRHVRSCYFVWNFNKKVIYVKCDPTRMDW